jgi:hypothetical protein
VQGLEVGVPNVQIHCYSAPRGPCAEFRTDVSRTMKISTLKRKDGQYCSSAEIARWRCCPGKRAEKYLFWRNRGENNKGIEDKTLEEQGIKQ